MNYSWEELKIKKHTSPEKKARMQKEIEEELVRMGIADQLRKLLAGINISRREIREWFDTPLGDYGDRTPFQIINDGQGEGLIIFMKKVVNNEF